MSVTTSKYFAFLIIVFFAYWSIINRQAWRTAILLGASYLYYSQAGPLPLLLLFSISTIDFVITRVMSKCGTKSKRKLLLCASLLVDIGVLCVFKYANFFVDSVNGGLSIFGQTFSLKHLNILAPIGISFFIFQSVAYVVDVYRKDTEPARNYFEYLSFISFFPTIIAGPILRAKQLLPQLRESKVLTAEIGGQALFLIAIGLIKKMAIADYLATNFVDRVFDFPDRFSSLEVLAAIYGYALQIYADFSGYSDIAIGAAMLLGFKLPENFNVPYRSENLPEFWRRWHISLSTWLRDYVFFSVVGRRMRNSTVMYAGLIVTMLIGGLWHGPTWTFVLWGALHGVGLASYRWFSTWKSKKSSSEKWGWLQRRNTIASRAIAIVLTFHYVCLTWVFFRAETVGQAKTILLQLFNLTGDITNLAPPVLLIIAAGLFAQLIPENFWEGIRSGFVRLPAFGQAVVLTALAAGLYTIASSDVVPFIYTRF
jgi:D-alanyl-lipoteichoic acid acyltransferase DltB (MBOAT superfamily)